MDTQAIGVVTYDSKGTHVSCFVSGSTDCQINFFRCKTFLNNYSW